MSMTTDARVKTDASQYQNSVETAAGHLEAALAAWFANSSERLTADLATALEAMILTLASDTAALAAVRSWKMLATVNVLIETLEGGCWTNSGWSVRMARVPAGATAAAQALIEAVRERRNPPPREVVTERPIETLKQLTDQGVSPLQIARIFQWFLPGTEEPDYQAVMRAQRGEDPGRPIPTTRRYVHRNAWPEHCPPTDTLLTFAGRVENAGFGE